MTWHNLPAEIPIFYEDGSVVLIHADCRDILPLLPKVNLVLTDPPYYKVTKNDWDNQWATVHEFTAFIEGVIKQTIPILSDSGSMLMFCDAWVSAYLQVMLDRYMTFLNHIVWHTTNALPQKNATNLRSFSPMTERVLFYANGMDATGLQTIHSSSKCFTPIKDYMRGERDKLMDEKGFKTLEQFNQFVNGLTNTKSVVSHHYFADSQYTFPTPEIYAMLQTTGFFRRTYEDLRRTFNIQTGICDVIALPIVGKRGNTAHPTTKPLSIISVLMQATSNPADLILDPFCGSGTTLVAAKQLGRKAIGVEISEAYCKIAVERLKQEILI